jgi:hypothetical protein
MTSPRIAQEIKALAEEIKSTCRTQETMSALDIIIKKCENIIEACEEGWY